MTVKAYLRDKLVYIICILLSLFFSGMFLWLIGVRRIFILFTLVLWVVPCCVAFCAEYYKKKRYYAVMERLVTSLDEKTLLSEMLEDADFLDGQLTKEQLVIADKYMNDRIADYDRAAREYKEYVEMWVHEIKTPISMANLLIDNNKTPVTRKIADELFQVEKMVEQALFYARGTSLEKDFLVKPVLLEDLVSGAVKSHAKILIQARASIEQENLQMKVFADEKWMVFIIGQVLSNAVKYRKEQLILHFEGEQYKDKVCLKISDNGVGISAKELGRIFDKGFTGSNGRKNERSTGIGLYLCWKLADKMNLGIRAESVEGEGTTIVLTFPVGSMTEVAV